MTTVSRLPAPNNAAQSLKNDVRQKLATFMTQQGMSARNIQSDIESVRADIAGSSDSRRQLISHDTVRRFISTGSISPTRLHILQLYLITKNQMFGQIPDPQQFAMFSHLASRFGVGPARIEECKTYLSGVYEFYALSEDRRRPGRRYIVIGAMNLDSSPDGNALIATERQEEKGIRDHKQSTIAEEIWNGHYFMRQGRVVIILRGKYLEPKFYILEKRHNATVPGDESVTSLHGVMIKLGTAAGTFYSPIYMRRNNRAFLNCEVVPENHQRIDQSILGYLGIN